MNSRTETCLRPHQRFAGLMAGLALVDRSREAQARSGLAGLWPVRTLALSASLTGIGGGVQRVEDGPACVVYRPVGPRTTVTPSLWWQRPLDQRVSECLIKAVLWVTASPSPPKWAKQLRVCLRIALLSSTVPSRTRK
jgi:hypothetical protein